MLKKYPKMKYLVVAVLLLSLLFPAVSSSDVSADNLLLRVGDQGSSVKELQSNLNDSGAKISADGIFGQATKKAVKAFQKKKGLQIDGIAGPKTLKALKVKVSKNDSKKDNKKSNSSLIRSGDKGSKVKELQKSLKKHGYKISADGIFGPDTSKALKSFQKKKGLQVDGIAGSKTLKALKGKTSNTETPKKDNTKSNTVRSGDKGSKVKELQSSLNKHGYSISADGIFGPATLIAVKSFQNDKGLSVDGIVGADTWAKIKQSSDSGKNNEPDSNGEKNDIVSTAESLVGTPYVWGGTTTSGFDSSGFINYVFKQSGVTLSRTHADMWVNNGIKVKKPAIGDVVFFEGTYKDGISHSGIYIGNGNMIHAGTEKTGVEITSMEISYWSDKYIGAKSML